MEQFGGMCCGDLASLREAQRSIGSPARFRRRSSAVRAQREASATGVRRPRRGRYARRVDEARIVSAGSRSRHRCRGGCDPIWNLPRSHDYLHRRASDRPGTAECLAGDRRNRTQGDESHMKDRVPIRKLPSGVPGLDEVLGGGIPEFSFNLIAGGPGCGKTTLGHQITFANASPARKAVYFSIIGEPPIKMLRYQQQYSFFDSAKIGDGSVRFIHLGQEALDGGLAKVLEALV